MLSKIFFSSIKPLNIYRNNLIIKLQNCNFGAKKGGKDGLSSDSEAKNKKAGTISDSDKKLKNPTNTQGRTSDSDKKNVSDSENKRSIPLDQSFFNFANKPKDIKTNTQIPEKKTIAADIPNQPKMTTPEKKTIPNQPKMTTPEKKTIPNQPKMTTPEKKTIVDQPKMTSPEKKTIVDQPKMTTPEKKTAEKLTINKISEQNVKNDNNTKISGNIPIPQIDKISKTQEESQKIEKETHKKNISSQESVKIPEKQQKPSDEKTQSPTAKVNISSQNTDSNLNDKSSINSQNIEKADLSTKKENKISEKTQKSSSSGNNNESGDKKTQSNIKIIQTIENHKVK